MYGNSTLGYVEEEEVLQCTIHSSAQSAGESVVSYPFRAPCLAPSWCSLFDHIEPPIIHVVCSCENTGIEHRDTIGGMGLDVSPHFWRC